MIFQENVTLILCVCRLEEGGRSKCHKYWPSPDSYADPAFSNVLKDLEVSLIKETKLSETLVERIFEVKDKSGKSLRVRQLHYVGWPDHGVPSGTSMKDFNLLLSEFINMIITSQQNEKALVHCSAGIGRTGTTICLMENIINLYA